ncbi:MAG: glycosyltransferase [Alphaproteobacteria bacterium]|nr:glycosyltransferase [Alphaproteobacteria bacterium]
MILSGRQRHLVVFARAPQFGAIKRRLARDVGAATAWRFYRDTLDATLAKLHRPQWTCWLALTPDRLAPRYRNVRFGWYTMAQGSGDLGDRMARVFAVLPRGPAIVVGSDIPAIGPTYINEAFVALETKQAVFGPAADGGYWLVGLRRRPIAAGHLARTLFRDVRWSTRHALADTLGNAPAHWRIAIAATLHDVDHGADFGRRGVDATGWSVPLLV